MPVAGVHATLPISCTNVGRLGSPIFLPLLPDLLALLASSYILRSPPSLRRVVVVAFYFLAGAGTCAIVVEQ
jgi:hypothetical protein